MRWKSNNQRNYIFLENRGLKLTMKLKSNPELLYFIFKIFFNLILVSFISRQLLCRVWKRACRKITGRCLWYNQIFFEVYSGILFASVASFLFSPRQITSIPKVSFNPYLAKVLILYPLKTPENQRYSQVNTFTGILKRFRLLLRNTCFKEHLSKVASAYF